MKVNINQEDILSLLGEMNRRMAAMEKTLQEMRRQGNAAPMAASPAETDQRQALIARATAIAADRPAEYKAIMSALFWAEKKPRRPGPKQHSHVP